MQPRYWIVYTIEQLPGEHRAGPYPTDELESQRRDLRGYGAKIIREELEESCPPTTPLKQRLDQPIL